MYLETELRAQSSLREQLHLLATWRTQFSSSFSTTYPSLSTSILSTMILGRGTTPRVASLPVNHSPQSPPGLCGWQILEPLRLRLAEEGLVVELWRVDAHHVLGHGLRVLGWRERRCYILSGRETEDSPGVGLAAASAKVKATRNDLARKNFMTARFSLSRNKDSLSPTVFLVLCSPSPQI